MKNFAISMFVVLTAAAAVAGCEDENAANVTAMRTDAGGGTGGTQGTNTGPITPGSCAEYCATVTTSCTGQYAQYKDQADCLAYCGGTKWPSGTPGEQTGNTISCRTYHGMVAKDDPATHCTHAGPSGGEICGRINTRTDAVTAYAQVDRMGMPAVATALVSGNPRKAAYNDANPVNDVKDFLADWGMRLKTFHDALDDDLMALGVVPCSMVAGPNGLPPCLTQEYAPGKTVASLIAPSDVIRINPAVKAGFPNGRRLEDPVIDVTLSVLLLDLTKPNQAADSLAKKPLNPPKNDVANGAFLAEFPYLHPPHQ
jgi:Domain of unknown function (DUF4331)